MVFLSKFTTDCFFLSDLQDLTLQGIARLALKIAIFGVTPPHPGMWIRFQQN